MASLYNEVRAPLPTAAPPQELVEARLGLRQEYATTCGWVGGLAGPDGVSTGILDLECNAGYVCAFNSILGADGCCPYDQPISDCIFATQCYGYGDGPESLPAMAVTCDDPTHPACGGVVFGGGVTSFLCVESKVLLQGTLNPSIPPLLVITATAEETVVVSAVVSSASVTATPGGNTHNQNSGSSSSSSGSGGGGLAVGAIAGIAVGAVLILAALAALFFFMRRRSKRNANVHQTMMSQQQDYMPPPQHATQTRSMQDTASWVSTQPSKVPASTVHEYPPHNFNDDDDGMTFAGTVDHDGAPRV